MTTQMIIYASIIKKSNKIVIIIIFKIILGNKVKKWFNN